MTKKLSLFLATLLLISPLSAAFAQESAPTSGSTDRTTLIQELHNANVARRCQIITSNVTRILARYDATHKFIVERHDRFKANLDKAITRLRALGYDTSAVETKLQQMETLVKQYSDTHTKFITALQDSRTLQCGNSQGAFVAKVKEARDLAKQMHDQSKQIVEFYRTELKPALQALRQEHAVSAPVRNVNIRPSK